MVQMSSQNSRCRVAIVGGGISGMGCMWGLRHGDHEVHLYEADPRLGGHANTVTFNGRGHSVPVDTGFIAMNEKTYPKFTAFLKSLKVETLPTDMSFAVSEDNGAFEWASTSLGSFIGRIFQLFNPWFWRLVFDIIRFNYSATELISKPSTFDLWSCDVNDESDRSYRTAELESIGEYLDRQGYSEQFKRYYLVPMVAAPWCIDPDEFSRDFPAATLIRFMAKQSLLSTTLQRLQWRTVKNGSRTYVDAFLDSIQPNHHVHLNTSVKSCVRQREGNVSLLTANGSVEVFDNVVLAVHAHQALAILGEGATTLEKDILRHFRTSTNVCYLHSDMSLMPRRPNARASWNCLMQSTESSRVSLEEKEWGGDSVTEDVALQRPLYPQRISVTFDMNKLQGIPEPGQSGSPGRVLVSMNPIHPPCSVKGTYRYNHPLFSSASVLAARRLHEINGVSGISFAGAWMGYGFHEDGIAAGLHVAQDLLHIPLCSMLGTSSSARYNEWAPRWRLRDTICRKIIKSVQSSIDTACRSNTKA